MGIELIWEEEDGSVLAALYDPTSLVEQFLPPDSEQDFVCLRFVDPYGDAIFNRLQLPRLLEELKRCSEKPHAREVAEHILAAVALVKKAQGHVHTYVRFAGD